MYFFINCLSETHLNQCVSGPVCTDRRLGGRTAVTAVNLLPHPPPPSLIAPTPVVKQ